MIKSKRNMKWTINIQSDEDSHYFTLLAFRQNDALV